MEVGLLEVQVDLGTFCGGGWEEVAQDLGLEALGDAIVELELGVEGVDGVP